MKNENDFDGFDVIPPKGPVTLSIELNPAEVELAFATEGTSIRPKLLMALVVAMINDPIA
jgi:hypothetical protein